MVKAKTKQNKLYVKEQVIYVVCMGWYRERYMKFNLSPQVTIFYLYYHTLGEFLCHSQLSLGHFEP